MRKTLLLFIFTLFISCQQKEIRQEDISESKAIIEFLNSDEFATHIQGGDVQLIDVRMKSEFNEGHIKGAKNHHIYDKDFKEQVSSLDKDQPVYLYCKAGARSEEAALQLKEMGFKQIYDLKGGISSWRGGLE